MVAALAADLPPDAGGQLPDLEEWQVRQVCARLAPDGAGLADLERDLRAYRTVRNRATRLEPHERREIAEAHGSWIATYEAALADFRPGDPVEGATLQRRRLATASAPFAQFIDRTLGHHRAAANAAAGRELIGPGVTSAYASHLVDRFELALTWALEAHQNVVFARSGVTRDSATADHHDHYFRRTFGDAAGCHEFYMLFPVLGRWLATVAGQLAVNGRRLVDRLATDAGLIGEQLFGQPVESFIGIQPGLSDYHAGGSSVAIVEAELDADQGSFLYKPRSLDGELAVQRLLARLTADGVLRFATRRVVAMDGYGYEERIPEDRNHATSPGEVAQVYESLGGYLAIFYVLGGSDLHHENVMVANGQAFVCDCETVLGVELAGYERGRHTVADSVYRTGLLEWPLPASAEVVTRLSGYAGGGGYEFPFPLPRIQDGPAPQVRHETGVRIEDDTSNRVYLGGALVEVADYEASILRGFGRVHDWFRLDPAAPGCIEELFAAADVRFVARDTQSYAQLLVAARHPRCLVDPLEVDAVFRHLDEAPLPWDAGGSATAAERRSLWRLDVPTFSLPAAGRTLVHDHATPLDVQAARSPLAFALDRIATLPADDQERQASYISASLATSEVRSDSFVATALDWAQLVGRELAALIDGAGTLRWTYADGDAAAAEVASTLYYGSGGVALFLAYLDAVSPAPGIREAAERALDHALRHPPPGIGAFDGLAGHAYLLTHLHALWGERWLLERAGDLVPQLADAVPADRSFDVLSGSAGVIAVLLGLAPHHDAALPAADRAARHLLDHCVRSEHGLSWPPPEPGTALANLTGFAHGSAGIGWALGALGGACDRDELVEAALAAFAYERSHFDEAARDWADLRVSVQDPTGRPHFGNAWCNGAPGIGLSRIASWVTLGKNHQVLLDEAYIALASTLRGLESAGNDTLCHGLAGNSELLLRVAELDDSPAFQLEANVQAQAMWRRLASAPDWPREEAGRQPLSGLMAGIAGVGMHCLRLAHPGRVPSPLLLDPPPTVVDPKEVPT